MKEHIGYKVLTDDLHSAIIGNSKLPYINIDGLKVKYSMTDWTFPNNPRMPLMVFQTLDCATFFYKTNLDIKRKLVIYKCKYVKSKKLWGSCASYIDKILDLIKKKKKFSHSFGYLPKGTDLADKVLLLERI